MSLKQFGPGLDLGIAAVDDDNDDVVIVADGVVAIATVDIESKLFLLEVKRPRNAPRNIPVPADDETGCDVFPGGFGLVLSFATATTSFLDSDGDGDGDEGWG